jgi:IS5 family transposase
MLTVDNKQADLFETWIPEHMLQLSEELAFADKALDNPRVLEPFVKDPKSTGRPTTAITTYLRMMYLKFRYQMSYEIAVKEISDSYKWRRFCHLPMTGAVPDDKTLIKLTGRFGEAAVRAVHDAIVRQAVEDKIIRGRKMRLDTTVNESNIHYPTDTGLMSDGVRVISRTIRKIKEVVRLKTRFRNRTRSIKRRILKVVKFLKGKNEEAKKKRERIKAEILAIAQAAWKQALAVLAELRSGKAEIKPEASNVRLATLPLELKHWLELMKRVLEQTQTVLGGNTHIPDRLVSLFDPGARPIQKGKLFPKTEFGRKVLIQEAENGIVTDYQTHQGNPRDDSLLDSAVDKHEDIFSFVPKELAADRGFHSPDGDDRLHERGITHVSIPVKGNKTGMRARTERSSWFRRLQRWRAGGEAKISLLKRKCGLRKSLARGDTAAAIWIGWGIIAHNLTWMARAGP